MPKEVMRIIVKNYYKNRKPEKMITWWWREARQVADRQPNAAPSEDQARETGLSMPTRLPANSRMTKSKKAFSRTRFANLIRRNSIQLKTKGTVLIWYYYVTVLLRNDNLELKKERSIRSFIIWVIRLNRALIFLDS